MVNLKTEKEILIMQEGGRRLKKVVAELLPSIIVGSTTKEIDDCAYELIKKQGGGPSFKEVEGYYWTTCLPVNNQVVHTPPSTRRLENGDILTVDIGMYFEGFHTDYATTIIIGEAKDQNIKTFLNIGKEALYKAIDEAKPGKRLGNISRVIEKEIYGNNYFILKDLTGHGIGRSLHEDPYVLGYLNRPIEKTLIIKPGLVIAIEIIYSMSTEKIAHEKNNDWSITTSDHSLSACFEHTVAITDKGNIVLT